MEIDQILSEARNRKQELFRQLDSSPETEITGVVDGSGVGGGHSTGEDEWTLLFSFSGWKAAGEDFQKSTLTVRKLVPENEISIFQGKMRPYDVVRIKARFSNQNIFASPQALLVDLLGKDYSDSEVLAYARELQKPVTFEDPQFGMFTLDRRVDWYETATAWKDSSIRFTIPHGESNALEKSLSTARSLWKNQDKWQQKIDKFVVEELLHLKNGTWLDEDESEVTAQEFTDRIALESVSVKDDESFEFWFNDDDLFWGHSIMVSGNLKEGLQRAQIQG